MSPESPSNPYEINPPVGTPSFPFTPVQRTLFGILIAVVPAFSFFAAQFLRPDWQSGELSAYIALLLSAEASAIFFPLLAYSTICIICILISPSKYAALYWIRFGVYTAVLLSLQYFFLVAAYLIADSTLDILALILVCAFPFVAPKVYRWAVSKWNADMVFKLLWALLALSYLILAFFLHGFLRPLFFVLVGIVIAAPFWIFYISTRTTIWLYRNFEQKITPLRGMGLVAWIATYIAALRFDINKMYELYAALPTQPPDCYIATAAARGHSRFVHSRLIHLSHERQLWVNPQLQRFKAAELVLMVIAPRLHHQIRRIYDVVGKRLAQQVQNPFMADIAYLLLKPMEWIVTFVSQVLISESKEIAATIYVGDHQG